MDVYGKPIIEAQISKSDITNRLSKVKGRYFVYILINGNIVEYVGMTGNLLSRLIAHKYTKNFDMIYLCEYRTKRVCSYHERMLIRHYLPKQNQRCK
jgi:predicted GIY-YIG superfamily endonuclease